MDLFWRFLFVIAVGGLVWLLHSGIGCYPPPLTRSENPHKEMGQAILLWGVAVIVPILMLYEITPWLDRVVANRTLREFAQAPLLTLAYVVLPLFIIRKNQHWKIVDLGLTLKNRSRSVTIFAIAVGLASGLIAAFTGQSNIRIDPLPAGVLVILIYNNAFLEEFYHRGVIQSLLERAAGQGLAVGLGGLLFGMTHIAFDIASLAETGGILVVFSAVLLQTMAGWMFGIIYMKTRTLWPGITCHYLANWLPSILMSF